MRYKPGKIRYEKPLVFVISNIGNSETATTGTCSDCGGYMVASHFGKHVEREHVEHRERED